MKYFIVETESANNSVPQISNWFQQITARDICSERAGNIPDYLVFDIKTGQNYIFPDVFSAHGFLLSSVAFEVIHMYEPHLRYKKIALVDAENGHSALYYLPILFTYDCLLPETEWSMGKNKVIRGVIDPSLAENRPIFRLGGVTDTQIAVRLDVVESLLRRGAKCLKLTELEVKEVK